METTLAERTETPDLPFQGSIPLIVPVQFLDDDRLTLKRPFYVVVEEVGDAFVATFFDAHISSSGETQYEAVDNVKDLVVATFNRLDKTPPEKLGPIPSKQIAALRYFISAPKALASSRNRDPIGG